MSNREDWAKYMSDKYGVPVRLSDKEPVISEGQITSYNKYLNKKFNDMVNHPTHYASDPSGVECIEITRHRNFNIGNAIKYLWRAGLKDSNKTIEDLEKAIFYINDEINRLRGSK